MNDAHFRVVLRRTSESLTIAEHALLDDLLAGPTLDAKAYGIAVARLELARAEVDHLLDLLPADPLDELFS
jgi:hypothetical protein